ncbi:hypothetical protein ACH3XW_37535 [Acanthocheilonema viteae]
MWNRSAEEQWGERNEQNRSVRRQIPFFLFRGQSVDFSLLVLVTVTSLLSAHVEDERAYLVIVHAYR